MRIGQTLKDGINEIVAFLPNLIGFLLLLLIGFVVAKVVSTIVRKVLEKLGIDDKIRNSDANRYVDGVLPGATVSGGVAKLIFWFIFIFFIFSAIGALKIPALTGFMESVLAYLPNVIAAVLIFVVAALVSGAVAAAVTKMMGDTPTGKIVATVLPALVMVIALFMILEQLQIAPEIVRIAFAAVMFALALGLALAFGLGGRSVAQRLLEDAYSKGQQQKQQVKQDLQHGKENAQHTASSYGGSTGSTGTTTTTGETTTVYPTQGPTQNPPQGPTGGTSTY